MILFGNFSGTCFWNFWRTVGELFETVWELFGNVWELFGHFLCLSVCLSACLSICLYLSWVVYKLCPDSREELQGGFFAKFSHAYGLGGCEGEQVRLSLAKKKCLLCFI